MAAYMIALTDMHDPSWIEEYVAAVPAIIAEYGGEYVANGMGPQLLEGAMDLPDSVTVFRFPSLDAIHAFLESEEYQPYIELRKSGSTISILAFESTI